MRHADASPAPLARNRAALALICGLHLLALLAWVRQRPLPPPRWPEARLALRILLPGLTPAPRPPEAEAAPILPMAPLLPAPALPTVPAREASAPAAADPAAATPVTAAAAAATAAAAAATATAASSAPALEDARAPLTVQDAIREQKATEGGFGLQLSKRQAGRIDRVLRDGKSGIPEEPDTPIGRFRRALEGAHVDRSMAVRQDSYTAPDGTVIYRTRIGKGSYCRRSGSISPLGMRKMVMGHEAGDTACPKGVPWKDE